MRKVLLAALRLTGKVRNDMHHRVFFSFERSGKSVSSTHAVEMNARSIREQLLGQLESDDDFIGILDSRENVLQIMREPGEERYWVELPIEAARASYGRLMDRAELEALLQDLPLVLDREQIAGLKYRPW